MSIHRYAIPYDKNGQKEFHISSPIWDPTGQSASRKLRPRRKVKKINQQKETYIDEK